MKKNYFYGLCKAFGIIPILILSAIFVLISNIGLNSNSFAMNNGNAEMLGNLIQGGFYALFIGFAVMGLSKLKQKGIGFLDFIRITACLGALGTVIIYTVLDNSKLGSIIFYAVIVDILLIELIIRAIYGKYDGETKYGLKGYSSALARTINPLLVLVLGVGLGTVLYFNVDGSSKFTDFLTQYATGISIGIVGLSLFTSLKKEHVGIIDAVLSVLFFTGLTVVLYSLNTADPNVFKALFILTLAFVMALIYRGASYQEEEAKTAKIKMNRYFMELYRGYDVSISVLFAFLIIGLFNLPQNNRLGLNVLLESIGFGSIPLDKMCDALTYVAVGMMVLTIILTFVFRNLKNPEIKKIDNIANLFLHIAFLSLPYFIIICSTASTSFENIKNSISLMVGVIGFAVVLVFAVILQILRLVYYKGELLEAAEEEIEDSVAEEPSAEEEHPEEVVEETTEETPEETLESEEVVEEVPAEEEVEVVYVDEEGNPVEVEETEEIVSEEDMDEEDDEEIEDVEEPEEIEEEEPAEEVVVAKEKGILMPEVSIVDENGEPKKIKRRFNTRMMFAPYEAKEYYNEIKNYLLMYRAKGRYSSRCETFRYKGVVAKVTLAGKSIKVFLAIDPQSLQDTKYHFKDVSDKKRYAEVPVMVKVRSARGLKYFKELVDMMMVAREVKPKRNYQPTNFMPSLIPNGEAILSTLGMSTDYLYPTMNVKSIPSEMPNDLIDYLPVIQSDEEIEEEIEANVYLDTLCNHFEDGTEITIDVLKSLHIINKGNVLRVKARGTLDRKLIIYAEYFDADALKMLMCTNCTAIKIIR